MFKSKILLIACFCLSVFFLSCTEETDDLTAEAVDLQELTIFKNSDPEVTTLFEIEDDQKIGSRGASNQVAVPFGPDLIISRITTTIPVGPTPCAATPMPNANCGINYTYSVDIRNIGNQTAPSGHDAAFWYSVTGTFVTGAVTVALAPGQSTTVNIGTSPVCSGIVPPSIEQFIAFADIYNTVAETNETNNRSRAYDFCLN